MRVCLIISVSGDRRARKNAARARPFALQPPLSLSYMPYNFVDVRFNEI
jgi:hypothetical protein